MKAIFIVLSLLIAVACAAPEQKQDKVPIQDQTPEVFEENKMDVAIKSVNRRYSKNIIDELYQEALEKDTELSSLENAINEMSGKRADSLSNYKEYLNNNQRYWHAVNRYISQIQDTTLELALKRQFELLKENYEAGVNPHKVIAEDVQLLEQQLYDQHLILKLMVTAPMMQNYQQNERPQQAPLKSIQKQYDQLIDQTKQVVQTNERLLK